MRLRDIQHLLRQALPIQITAENVPIPGGQVTAIQGRAQIRERLGYLAQIPGLATEAEGLLRHGLFDDPAEAFKATPAAWSDFSGRFGVLHTQAMGLKNIVDSILSEETDDTFGFRLPDGIATMQALAEATEEVQQTIDQLLLELGHQPTQLVGVDRGTNWLELIATGPGAISLITTAYGVARLVAFDWLKMKREKVQIEAVETDVEQRKMLMAYQDKLFRFGLRKHASQVVKEAGKNGPEPLEKAMVYIEKLAKLTLRGSEIRLALTAPAPVKKRLAETVELVETLKGLEAFPEISSTPQLTDGDSEEDDEGDLPSDGTPE